LKNLISDASNKKWYEGPAFANSTRAPIGYPISIGKRFFVTVSTGNKPKDGSTIQFGIPLNGVSTVYGSLGPSDISIANAYVQTVDSQAPSVSALISPAVNEVIYGQITLSAAAEDSVQVGRVEFFDGIPGDNNLPIAFDEDGPPWQAVWDCSNAGFGAHTLYVRVFDKTNRISHYRDSSGVPVIIGLSRSIPLYTGWNFISISLESFDPNVSSMLSSIGSNARSIWAYDAISSKWLRYDLDGPSFLNDLEKIGPYTGYQLFMNAPGILKVSGTPPEKTIALHSGWNLVGFNSQEPLDIIEAISSITAYNPVIWILDAQTGQWMNYDPKNPNNDLSILEPGKAYWFHVDGDCVWELE